MADATARHCDDFNSSSSSSPVELQIIAITDYHGYLQPSSSKSNGEINSVGGPLVVGGAAYMAAHIKQLRKGHANSLLLSNGDNFSGWPFEVSAFKNEPTIEVLNALGVDASSAGNHEFDISAEYLVDHMLHGECFGTPDVDSCFTDSTGQPFHGCDFPYVSANVRDKRTGELILPPYVIRHIPDGCGGSIPIGIIGLTIEDTFTEGPMSLQPNLLYTEPLVETANRYAQELQDQGVQTIIVLLHQGGSAKSSGTDFNGFSEPWGAGIEFAKVVSPAIDVVITGHWHASYNGFVADPDGNPRPVVQGSHHGKLITVINLFIDPATKDVIRAKTTCTNIANTRDISEDVHIAEIVSYWVERAQRKRLEPVARLAGDVVCARNEHGESPAANLVADAFYAAAVKSGHPVDFALTVGTPKRDLSYAKGSELSGYDGILTLGELYEAFGAHQSVLTVTLTGRQIKQALEEQWSLNDDNAEIAQFLNVSFNVRYTYNREMALGARVSADNILINGQVLDPDRLYRVATNGVVAANGGGYPALTECANLVRIAAWPVHEYLKNLGVIQVPATNRMQAVTGMKTLTTPA